MNIQGIPLKILLFSFRNGFQSSINNGDLPGNKKTGDEADDEGADGRDGHGHGQLLRAVATLNPHPLVQSNVLHTIHLLTLKVSY